jgi:transposase
VAERSEDKVVVVSEMAGSDPLGALADRGSDPARAAPGSAKRRDPEVVPRARRRTFTSDYKLRILREADGCGRGEVAALLRREGLYASHLTDWRQAAAAGLEPVKRGPKARPVDPNAAELKALRRDKALLERRLAKAELIIDIQKKVASLLGIPLQKPDFGEDA